MTTRTLFSLPALSSLPLVWVLGCGASSEGTPPPKKTTLAPVPADPEAKAAAKAAAVPDKVEQKAKLASAPIDLPKVMVSGMDQLIGQYEVIRATLAKDTVEPIPAAAKRLGELAAELGKQAPDAAKPLLEDIEWAASALEAPGYIEAHRLRFGDLSRAVVGLISSTPTLAKDRHVFECPMADGYKKWVQSTAALENPYMGSKMPRCGGESHWERMGTK
ncbi:MAG: hypothetical protein V3V08_17250 [Nannocystaceae bacterium]